jgi:hypothetical protein
VGFFHSFNFFVEDGRLQSLIGLLFTS